MLSRLFRRTAFAFGRVSAFLAVLICLSLVWSWWEVRQLHAYCAEAVPGTPVSALPALTDQHGFRRLGKPDDAQVFLVPRYTALGLYTCVIRHDGAAVISASLEES